MFTYTIATLVTDWKEYDEMKQSFIYKGFTDAQYLTIDNSQLNTMDAYRGVNHFLNLADKDYVIICHQDVRLIDHDINILNERINVLNVVDGNWAIFGNVGGLAPGLSAIRISDPTNSNIYTYPLPCRTHTLDENFLVIKRTARIGTSIDLKGFNYYGTDLCLHADLMGYSSYVVDFHLLHKGGELMKNKNLIEKDKYEFEVKWKNALRGRILHCSVARMDLV
jgi:hypothetical protein